MTDVVIWNRSTVFADARLGPLVAALQTQVSRDFAPAWGIDANILALPSDGLASDRMGKAWQLVIADDSDQAGALGYHQLTEIGIPIGFVFAHTDLQYGLEATVTASHELLELLADPWISGLSAIYSGPAHARIFATEVCDAVEADELGYDIDGIRVSNFVLPSYFGMPAHPAGHFDFLGQLRGPAPAMMPGGYIGEFVQGQGWTQVTRGSRRLARAGRYSRRNRIPGASR